MAGRVGGQIDVAAAEGVDRVVRARQAQRHRRRHEQIDGSLAAEAVGGQQRVIEVGAGEPERQGFDEANLGGDVDAVEDEIAVAATDIVRDDRLFARIGGGGRQAGGRGSNRSPSRERRRRR